MERPQATTILRKYVLTSKTILRRVLDHYRDLFYDVFLRDPLLFCNVLFVRVIGNILETHFVVNGSHLLCRSDDEPEPMPATVV